ncbi:hypothetical protein PtA15_15A14 [Puccinia triticina]|uniref:Uncharacterized protein n=1 Tax=Puccinia triticina TaxID=208348 RepID=A0ABY7D6L0_9BASI|nr:uncharacterized protein PtA15_15A14 [Puccinia triticina]WAQ91625.1 hypothetical protein PtA15_15A14 [Puccinia triticina]WAR62426.1 hypothetical protein PtB15_15B10 [Puccinia triticina]
MPVLPQLFHWLGIIVVLYTLASSAVVEAVPGNAFMLYTKNARKANLNLDLSPELARPVDTDLHLAPGPPASREELRAHDDPAKILDKGGRDAPPGYGKNLMNPLPDIDPLALSLAPLAPYMLAGTGKMPMDLRVDSQMEVNTAAGALVTRVREPTGAYSSQLPGVKAGLDVKMDTLKTPASAPVTLVRRPEAASSQLPGVEASSSTVPADTRVPRKQDTPRDSSTKATSSRLGQAMHKPQLISEPRPHRIITLKTQSRPNVACGQPSSDNARSSVEPVKIEKINRTRDELQSQKTRQQPSVRTVIQYNDNREYHYHTLVTGDSPTEPLKPAARMPQPSPNLSVPRLNKIRVKLSPESLTEAAPRLLKSQTSNSKRALERPTDRNLPSKRQQTSPEITPQYPGFDRRRLKFSTAYPENTRYPTSLDFRPMTEYHPVSNQGSTERPQASPVIILNHPAFDPRRHASTTRYAGHHTGFESENFTLTSKYHRAFNQGPTESRLRSKRPQAIPQIALNRFDYDCRRLAPNARYSGHDTGFESQDVKPTRRCHPASNQEPTELNLRSERPHVSPEMTLYHSGFDPRRLASNSGNTRHTRYHSALDGEGFTPMAEYHPVFNFGIYEPNTRNRPGFNGESLRVDAGNQPGSHRGSFALNGPSSPSSP